MPLSFEQNDHAAEQRCALVAGASRGIGLEIAARLAREGFRLTVSARDTAELVAAATTLAQATGATVHPVAADLSRTAGIRALTAAHADRFGRLDLLVLAAGRANVARLDADPLSTADAPRSCARPAGGELCCDVLAEDCLPLLRKTAQRHPQHGSRMVLVASADQSEASYARDYGEHKDALVALCDRTNLVESATGVSATTISPGHIDSDMTMWRHGHVNPDEMVISADLADVVLALTKLTGNAVVPNIVLARKSQPV